MLDNLLEQKYEMSLGKIILLFYLLSTSSTLFPLLSKQWKYTLENNRIAQHILGIITILSLTILVSNGKFELQRIIIYTIIGYFLFILSTKLDLHINIIVVGLLISYLLYQDTIKYKEEQIENDININNDNKIILQKNNKKNNIHMMLVIILVIIGGSLLYSNKKEGQYGGGYSITNFLIY